MGLSISGCLVDFVDLWAFCVQLGRTVRCVVVMRDVIPMDDGQLVDFCPKNRGLCVVNPLKH